MKCKLSIQEKLKDLRIEKGLSLQELSEQTGISRASLGNYETDDYKEITHKAIVTLAKFYGVSFFCTTYPEMMLIIFISAINTIHTYSHAGMLITGRNFIRHTTANTKSAAVSNLAPNSLTVFVLRAMVPSITSDKPAIR